MEAQGFVADDSIVQLESGRFQLFGGAGMAGVEHGHVVFLGDEVDTVEKVCEGFVVVYIFFAVGGEEEVFSFLQTQSLVDVRGPDGIEVCCQYFCHGESVTKMRFLGKSISIT